MKSGFVTIIGQPNVGKSTLLNKILNKKISIVTNKSQTTRNDIKGIYNDENSQIIFIDTPGIHKPHNELGEQMNAMALNTFNDVDILLLVVDASKKTNSNEEIINKSLNSNKKPLIIILNKIDLIDIISATTLKKYYSEKYPDSVLIECVAKDGFNIDKILETIKSFLPDGPKYYEEETITDKDFVFQIKEIIREKALRVLKDEVPHSMAVYMENIEWESTPVNIYGIIFVEKETQKGIVIGKNGQRIKMIGSRARKDIEDLLNKHVFLDLKVKVQEDWRNNSKNLNKFGYIAKK